MYAWNQAAMPMANPALVYQQSYATQYAYGAVHHSFLSGGQPPLPGTPSVDPAPPAKPPPPDDNKPPLPQGPPPPSVSDVCVI